MVPQGPYDYVKLPLQGCLSSNSFNGAIAIFITIQ
jgi:hypothetical protein